MTLENRGGEGFIRVLFFILRRFNLGRDVARAAAYYGRKGLFGLCCPIMVGMVKTVRGKDILIK